MATYLKLTWFGFYILKLDEIGIRLTLGQLAGTVLPGLGGA